LLDQLLDEVAAFQQAQDEAKRIQATEKRNEQVRQLFRKQAKANRSKVFSSKQIPSNEFNLYLE
jgi:hypothetical protein